MSRKHFGGFVAAFGLVLFAACDQMPTEHPGLDGTYVSPNSTVENGHASGEVSVTWAATNRSRGDIDLSAHEGASSSSERGTFEWEAYDAGGSLVRTMTITLRQVEVSGSEAKFTGEVTYDSWGTLNGYWYAFYAEDGGSPGPGNDQIRWTNSSTMSGLPGGSSLGYTKSDLPNRFTIVDGNLSVKE